MSFYCIRANIVITQLLQGVSSLRVSAIKLQYFKFKVIFLAKILVNLVVYNQFFRIYE